MKQQSKCSDSIDVLLVEDNPYDAELLMVSLAGAESVDGRAIRIHWEQTLAKGLEALSQLPYDAVLMDLTLPDADGLDSLSRIRHLYTKLPIVVMTGLDDKALGVKCVKLGAQDYLVKGVPGIDSIRRSILYAIERKAAEGAFKQLALLEQRETFIAMLAHDLRNPLIGCSRVLSLLLDGTAGSVPPGQAHLLSVMSHSVKSLLFMIGNVLDAYKIEAGGERLYLTAVDVSALLSECFFEMNHIAQAKNIRMSYSAPAGVKVHADAVAMRRVINNLLNNALKFTPDGGEIHASFTQNNGRVILKISDTGSGIPSEKIPSLFDRFVQTENEHRSTGLGLGLYICRELMKAQNGFISCQSKLGEGTTFELVMVSEMKTSVRSSHNYLQPIA